MSTLEETIARCVREEVRAALADHMRPVADANDPLVSARDAGVPVTSWRKAIKSGALVGVKVGRELRARRSHVDAWLASRTVEPAPMPDASSVAINPFDRALARKGAA